MKALTVLWKKVNETCQKVNKKFLGGARIQIGHADKKQILPTESIN